MNKTIYSITNLEKGSAIKINLRPIDLKNKLDFDFFNEKNLVYSYGNGSTLGVDSEKVIFLIENTDFEKIELPKITSFNWKTEKFNFPFEIKNEEIDKSPGTPTFGFSEPLFFEKGKYFLIYYERNYDALHGEGNLKVFKKENNRWVEYLQIPIWVI
ncbi:hypothetical protein [Mesonia sediminis]|uniref:hypothetical protein n=1 Tax=Mesonia sediminis TaxID=1703946 RepID=UPI00366C0595